MCKFEFKTYKQKKETVETFEDSVCNGIPKGRRTLSLLMEKLEIKFPAQSIQLITSSILHIPQRQQYEQKAKKSLMKKETSFYRVRSLHGLKMKNSVRLNPLNIFR